MDGYIQIGTKVDSSGVDKGIQEIQKKIDVAEKQKIEIQSKISVNKDSLKELEKDYNKLVSKADMLRSKMQGATSGNMTFSQLTASKDLETIIPKIDNISLKMQKLNGEIFNQEIKYSKINNQIDTYKNKIQSIEVKRQQQEISQISKNIKSSEGNAQKLMSAFSRIMPSTKGLNSITRSLKNSINGITSGVKKWGLALIGIRSAYMGLRKIMSTVQQYNKQISSDIQYIGFALASAFEPVVQAIISGLYKLLSLINQISSVIFGLNLFKNSGVDKFQKALKSASGSSKELSNNLAKFDDLDVLKEDNSSGGTASMDLSKNNFLEDFIGNAYDLGKTLGTKITEALTSIPWGDIQAKSKEIAYKIADLLNGLIDGIDWYVIGNTFAQGLNTVFTFAYSFIERFNWSTFGTAIGIAVNSFFANINWELLAQTISSGVIGVFNSISSFLEAVDWTAIGESIKTFFQNIDWKGIWEAVKKTIIDAVGGIDDLLIGIFGEDTATIIETIALSIGAITVALIGFNVILTITTALLSPINLIFLAIGVAIAVVIAVIVILIRHWEDFKKVALIVVKAVWEKLQQFGEFINNVCSAIQDAFVYAFKFIKDSIFSILEEIWDKFKWIINLIIGGAEHMVNRWIDGINKMIGAINNISFDLPDIMGGGHVGFSIPTIPNITLPRLAKGGIIAKPTQAMIGEAGKEAVVPLENNTEWLDLLENRIVSAIGNMQIEAKGNGQWGEFMRFINLELVKEQKRKGNNFIGGVY